MSTKTASPARNAASASSTDQTPRSPAKWLNVPAGITSSGRPASTAAAHAVLTVPSPPATPRMRALLAAPRKLVREGLPGIRFDNHGPWQFRP